MIGKRIFRERFQPRTCSGKKTPITGQVKGNGKNVILIDIDSDQVDDVVIIDLPEFMQQKSHGSSVPRTDRKVPIQSVISIDDDDSDVEEHPGTVGESGGELDSDASSSKRFSPAPGYTRNSIHIEVDDCHVFHEKGSASNLPSSRQTGSAKFSERNRYGLDESVSGSSESDCSDCELMEVCEQWEKASVKRKRHEFNHQANFDEHASSSGLNSNIDTDIKPENRRQLHAGSPIYSGPSNGKRVKENLSFSVMRDSQMHGIYFGTGKENPCKDSDKKVDQERFNPFKPESTEEMQSLHRNSHCQHRERTRGEDFSPCTKYKSYNFPSGVTGTPRFEGEMGDDKSKFMSSSQEESEKLVDNDGSALRNKEGNHYKAHSKYASFDERQVNQDGVVSQQSCDRQLNPDLGAEEKLGPASEGSLFCHPDLLGNSRVFPCSNAEVRGDSEVISMFNTVCNDSQDKQDTSCLVENEKPSDVGDALHAQDGGVATSEDRDIINKREKLKETDEYKRAIEEEWASRQRQLQIQAEEAQRLRKRKKAESKRLLDMQRRQKERIEEVRETQKKDEENLNMKEQLRAEIREELNKLEMTCIDMASLLRSLGIHVGGGFKPLPQEVNAAYKRALLKFHPDRASKAGIREQVEAEERFKLISRMKEKFLPTNANN